MTTFAHINEPVSARWLSGSSTQDPAYDVLSNPAARRLVILHSPFGLHNGAAPLHAAITRGISLGAIVAGLEPSCGQRRESVRERRSRQRRTERRAGYSRASDVGMPGSSTHGCLCSHHASTLGVTPDLSSSVPAFTARIPAGLTNAE